MRGGRKGKKLKKNKGTVYIFMSITVHEQMGTPVSIIQDTTQIIEDIKSNFKELVL